MTVVQKRGIEDLQKAEKESRSSTPAGGSAKRPSKKKKT